MRHRNRHRGAAICGQLRTTVKAEPTDPQKGRAHHHHTWVVRGGSAVFARTQNNREQQRRKTGRLVDDNAAGKVSDTCLAKNTAVGQNAAAPNPMHHWRIAQEHPKA